MSLAPAPKKILTRLSSLQKLLSRSPLSSTSRSLAKSSGLQRSRPQTLAAIHLRLSLRGERRQRREGGEGGARVRQRNWGSILQGNIINRGHDPDRRAATRGAGEAWRGVEHAPHGRRAEHSLHGDFIFTHGVTSDAWRSVQPSGRRVTRFQRLATPATVSETRRPQTLGDFRERN